MEVFVYGTLTDPDRARAVLGDAFEYGPPATLVGLRFVEGRYPTVAPPTSPDRRDRADRPADAGDGDSPPDVLADEARPDALADEARADPGSEESRGDTGTDDPRVEGRVLRTDRIETLDDYEGVDRGLYARTTVPVLDRPGESGTGPGSGGGRADAGAGEVAVYVGDPGLLDVDGVDWPGDGAFEARVREYVADAGVGVRVGER